MFVAGNIIIGAMAAKFLHRLSQALQKNKSVAGELAAESGKPLEIGTLVAGRYRLEAEIGRGGMGIVYRAHDIPNDRDVAFKVINLSKANVLTQEQFSREAEIMSRLHHPHIVRVHETGVVMTGTEAPSPFIVMELIQGTGLDELHNLTYAKILNIGKQICDALEYAHGQGIVYGDLKPGNVLIERRGFQYFAKLTDFGLARPHNTANLAPASNVAGTVFYLAPELIAGQPAHVRSDLYALGATLYEMITGRVPFSDFDERTILSQHLEASVTPPSHSRGDVPPALEGIILRLLSKNPEERFASAQEVCLALEQVTLQRKGSALHGNLPERQDHFTRYEKDVAEVTHLLELHQLVTLLGESDKLAVAVGAEVADQFADGVWRVELEAVSDPVLVPQIILSELGIQPDPNRSLTVSLVVSLREKNLLLILLHCDHLRAACAQFAETVLRACPDVRILATSSEPLNILAETCYRFAATID